MNVLVTTENARSEVGGLVAKDLPETPVKIRALALPLGFTDAELEAAGFTLEDDL